MTSSVELVCAPRSPLVGIVRAARRIAPTDTTVLLSGEHGTGKSLLAKLIHEASGRANHRLVTVSCRAERAERHLFGDVRDTVSTHSFGCIATAAGGTLFLDEVAALNGNAQARLLGLLQERSYKVSGGSVPLTANIRLIAATTKNLVDEVEAGRFRRDLYFRLMVCPFELPPLRDRPDDIMAAFRHFWQERRPIHRDVIAALEQHQWPGNMHELLATIETIASGPPGTPVLRGELPHAIQPAPRSPTLVADRFPVDLPGVLSSLENAYIEAALKRTQGNRKAAAELLGLQRTTLVEKLRRQQDRAATV